MKFLENKISPLGITVLFGTAMWGASHITPVMKIEQSWAIGLAIGLFTAGAVFAIAGVISFRWAATTVNPVSPESVSTLVTSGVYSISRNPMYVGFALFLFAWAVYLKAPAALLGIPLFMAYMNRFQIKPEENVLINRFGNAYANYKLQVRRWM